MDFSLGQFIQSFVSLCLFILYSRKKNMVQTIIALLSKKDKIVQILENRVYGSLKDPSLDK